MHISAASGQITVTYNSDEVPKGYQGSMTNVWRNNVYNRFGKKEFSASFDETNEYLKEMSLEERQRVFRFYENCSAILIANTSVNSKIEAVREQIVNIHDLLDLERVIEFNDRRAIFEKVALAKVNLIKKEELARTTYSDGEAYQLTCLSIVIKILAPVWGSMITAVRSETGVDWKERKILETMKGTPIEQSDTYQKLDIFCQAKAETGTNKVSVAARAGTTLESMQAGIMAVAVVKFLVTFNITGPKNIIAGLFQDTTSYIDVMAHSRMRDKGAVGGAGTEDDGIAQHWRRGQNTRPVDRAVLKGAIKDIESMIRDLKLTNTSVKQIKDLHKKLLDKPNKVTLLHMRVMAAAFIIDKQQIFSVKLLAIVDDKEVIRLAQAMAYFSFIERGCSSIAEFIISDYCERDASVMVNRVAIKGIGVDEHVILNEKYPLVNTKASNRKKHEETPGNKIMEEVVSFIMAHEFVTECTFEDIRPEFINLIKNM